MALLTDRYVFQDDISYFMNETGEQGRAVFLAPSALSASGVALDDTLNAVTHSHASGRMVVGVLLTSVVDIDTNYFHTNFHKDEVDVDVSPKVRVMKKGWFVTNNIIPATVTPGQEVYVHFSGWYTNSGAAGAATKITGRFLTAKNPQGYGKIEVNLP